MKRKLAITASVFAVILSHAGKANASFVATATISSQQVAPGSFKYSLTLTNSASSTENATSFWFGWFPGYDLLPSGPTSFTSPAGWSGTDARDSFGVGSAQWTTTSTSLAPGQTLSGFSFTTPDAPSAIIGASSIYGPPVEETYVYVTEPESGDFAAFVPTTVAAPEPTSLALFLGMPGLLLMRRRGQMKA